MMLLGAPAQESQDYELLEPDFSTLTPQRWLNLVALSAEREITLRLSASPQQQPPSPSVPASQRGNMPYLPSRDESRGRTTNKGNGLKNGDMSDGRNRSQSIVNGEHLSLVVYRRPHIQLESNDKPGHRFMMARQNSPARAPNEQAVSSPEPHPNSDDLARDPPVTPGQATRYGSALERTAPLLDPAIYADVKYSPSEPTPQRELGIHPKKRDLVRTRSTPEGQPGSCHLPYPQSERIHEWLSTLSPAPESKITPHHSEKAHSRFPLVGQKPREPPPPVTQKKVYMVGDHDYRNGSFNKDRVIVDPLYERIMPYVVSINDEPSDTDQGSQTSAGAYCAPESRSQSSTLSEFFKAKHKRHIYYPPRVRFASDARSSGSEHHSEDPLGDPCKDPDDNHPEGHPVDESKAYHAPHAPHTPFFKWGLRGGARFRTTKEASREFHTVLDQVKREMGHGSGRGLYLATFKCSKSELLCRHAIGQSWVQPTSSNTEIRGDGMRHRNDQVKSSRWEPPTPSKPRAAMDSIFGVGPNATCDIPLDGRPPEEWKGRTQGRETVAEDEILGPTISPGSGPDNDSHRPLENRSGTGPVDACQVLMRELFEITEKVMGAFLGDKGGEAGHGQTHDVYAAFWGSIDVIWRVSRSFPNLDMGTIETRLLTSG